MKILCECGELIPDITDSQNNKAYLIPDESWEAVLESIESGQSPRDVTQSARRQILQCYECSRLYIEQKNGDYVSFKPDKKIEFGILSNM